jgi:hypothetical protein
MNKLALILLLSISWIFVSGNSIQNTTSNEVKFYVMDGDIPFIEAKNYFVNNTFTSEKITSHKIDNQADFDVIFGVGRVMGENGKPTEIDFSKQFVIAVIGQDTDKSTSFSVATLKSKGKNIVLRYKMVEGEKLTYQIRPFMLLVVDNKYEGELKTEKI